jgi:RNA polymerase sigma-70 factor, ECF subfamily
MGKVFLKNGEWIKTSVRSSEAHPSQGNPSVTNDVGREITQLLPRLRRFAYALTGDPDKGDDLVQEGCARAFGHLDQWQAGTRLDSWMYRIVHNIWRDHDRAQRVRGIPTNLDSAPELRGQDGREVIEFRLTLNRVLKALEDLPPEQHVLISLVCFEGLSYQEAASVLGIPVGTVTSRLVRGRQALYARAVEGMPGGKGQT